jgi:hypothetical protein
MNTIFLRLSRILTLICLGFVCVTASARAQSGSLADEWGWIPERAGILAAESWGIKPQWSGKTLVEAYQKQGQALAGNRMVRNVIVPVDALPDLPPPVMIPVPQGFCEIIGEVSNDKLDPVAGAIVEIVGTGKSVETNAEGVFTFSAVASGNITIEASKLGFTSNTQSATALPGQKLTINIVLKVKAADGESEETMLEEETVVEEFQEGNQGDFNLSINMEAPKLTATMGREEFAKNNVSDAGEAIGKISGANIVDGKYAVVRGLADRYVTTTFNGAQIASADPSRKAVQLDLFPTSAIESIKVDKTYTPNLSGDFGGGAIDIITRSLPEERILQVSTKVTYNDALKSKINTRSNSDLGVWGDIGDEMPSVLETRDADGNVVFLDTLNTPKDELGERWRQLHDSQNLMPKEADSQLGYSQSLTYGETFELPNKMKLGLMTAFSRSSGDSSNNTDITNQTRSFDRDEFTRSVESAAYLSAALEINENHILRATYFNKHIAQEETLRNYNIIDDEENLNYGVHIRNSQANPTNTYGPDYIYYGESWNISPLERDLDIYQLSGSHLFFERGPRLDWGITRSSATESRPHTTNFEFGRLDFSSAALAPQIAQAEANFALFAVQLATELGLPNPQSYTWESIQQPMVDIGLGGLYDEIEQQNAVIPDDSRPSQVTSDHGASGSIAGKQRITRRTEKTVEDADHRHMNFAVPIYFDDYSDERYFEFGLGAASLFKERSTTARAYNLVLNSSSTTDPGFTGGVLTGPGGLGEGIAQDPTIISDYLNGGTNGNPYFVNDLTRNGLENIKTRLDQVSYYSNLLFRFDSSFLNAGVRFEKETYDIDISSTPLSSYTDEQIEGNGWENRDPQSAVLPAVSAGTSIFDKRLDFQVAWSQTVARPTFWEFIPSQTTDQSSGLGRRGNNNLSQTDIDNFDLSMTWKPSDATSIRASFFHKNLLRPLVTFYENGVLLYADSFLDQLSNSQRDFTGSINGLELEAEISEIGPFSIKSNFTYIDAQLEYFYVQNGETTSVISQLPYQPSYLANINFGYEYEPWKLNANFVYNYNGEYPVILKLTPQDSEVSRNAIHTFDLILSKVIETEHVDYTIKAGVKNIFNAVDTYIFRDEIYNSDTTGRSYWAEIQMSF